MRPLLFVTLILFLIADASLAQDRKSAGEKPQAKSNSSLTAEELEAQALKCRTAREAFELYTKSMRRMTKEESDKAQFRRRFWGAQAEKGVVLAGGGDRDRLQADELAIAALDASKRVGKDQTPTVKQALAICPDHFPSKFLMGYFAATYRKDHKTALRWFEECMELDSDHFETFHNLAVCYAAQGLWEDSLQTLQECERIDAAHPMLGGTLAKISSDMKRIVKSPDPDQRTVLSELDRLRNRLGRAGTEERRQANDAIAGATLPLSKAYFLTIAKAPDKARPSLMD